MMVSDSFKKSLHEKNVVVFLKKLYLLETNERAKRRKILNYATNSQLQLLIKLLRVIVTGEIPLRKKHWERIKQSKKLGFLHKNFDEESNYKKLKTSHATEQKQILSEINTYHQLLFNLFNI